jgi:endo-1,4-beta-mannosidase
MMTPPPLNRRQFVVGSAAVGAGLLLSSSTPGGAAAGLVTRSGCTLFRNGQSFRFGAGVNLYYAACRQPLVGPARALGAPDKKLASALGNLDRLTGGTVKVFRFWAFQNLATKSGVRDWAALDHVFAVAKSLGYLVIPCLSDEWGAIGDGGNTKTSTWFQSGYKRNVGPNDMVTYRQWVAEVTARYRNEPSILCWEFINEGSPFSNTSYGLLDDATGLSVCKAWSKDVADVIRANDPNHLLLNGLNYNNSGTKNYTTNYEQIIAYDGTDFFSYHDYAGATANTTAASEVTDLKNLRTKAVAADRPFLVGEVGVRISAGSARPADYAGKLDRYAAVPAGYSHSAYVGALSWVWNDSVDYMGSNTVIDDYYDLRPDVDAASLRVLAAHGSLLP